MLYFEACFYRGIDFAIKSGLSRVEAGAQGPHKISRGYLPSETYSGHWIRDKNFRHAVEDFVGRERLGVQQEMEALSSYPRSNALIRAYELKTFSHGTLCYKIGGAGQGNRLTRRMACFHVGNSLYA